MHISEGVLSAPVLLGGAAIAAVGLAIGLKKLDNHRIPEVAVMTSAFFVASLMRLPAGPLPTSIHLTLNGLMGLALGWAAFPAIFVGLSLQALLFQFGGFTTLGINTTIMAVPAVLAYYLFRPLLIPSDPKKKNPTRAWAVSFMAGLTATAGAALLMAASLIATEESFREAGWLIVGTSSFASIIEGLVTAFIATFLLKVRPEFFTNGESK